MESAVILMNTLANLLPQNTGLGVMSQITIPPKASILAQCAMAYLLLSTAELVHDIADVEYFPDQLCFN